MDQEQLTRYRGLRDRITTKVAPSSSPFAAVTEPEFQELVAMGQDALSLILGELKEHNQAHWWQLLAIDHIACKLEILPPGIPEESWGKLLPIINIYLKWGKEHFPNALEA